MNKLKVDIYLMDHLYPKVVVATAQVLAESDEFSPVAILLKIVEILHRGIMMLGVAVMEYVHGSLSSGRPWIVSTKKAGSQIRKARPSP